jgi:hypothetical protein
LLEVQHSEVTAACDGRELVVDVIVVDDLGEDSFQVEIDSHADTCCVGNGVMIVNRTKRTLNVTPCLKSFGSVTKVPIIPAAIAYDDPRSGEVFIPIFHQAIDFPEMSHCRLCPMQLRLNDVALNERSKFLTDKPTEKEHAVTVELIIPLDLIGVTSFFHDRMPTQKEYEECMRYELTYPDPEWCPHSREFAEEESRYVEQDGRWDTKRLRSSCLAVHHS